MVWLSLVGNQSADTSSHTEICAGDFQIGHDALTDHMVRLSVEKPTTNQPAHGLVLTWLSALLRTALHIVINPSSCVEGGVS